jgi:hypothetical protein
VVDYLHESAASIYRRRRRRRAEASLAFVIMLLIVTIVYSGSYVQGWIGAADAKSVTSASCSKDAAPPPLTPRDVRVNVYNGTGHPGLAAAVAAALDKQGFNIGIVDNDPLRRNIPGVAEIRSGDSGQDGANLVAQRLSRVAFVLDYRMDASVDVVLGKSYKVLKAPPKPAHAKQKKALPPC